MGISCVGSFVSLVIKFPVSPARKTSQNLQANFYAPFSLKISLSTYSLRKYSKAFRNYGSGCGTSRYFLEYMSLCFAIRCLETGKFYFEGFSAILNTFYNNVQNIEKAMLA